MSSRFKLSKSSQQIKLSLPAAFEYEVGLEPFQSELVCLGVVDKYAFFGRTRLLITCELGVFLSGSLETNVKHVT